MRSDTKIPRVEIFGENRIKSIAVAILSLVTLGSTPCVGIEIFAPETAPLDIPIRNDLVLDGDLSDWDAGAYTVVRLFSDTVGRKDSLEANLRVAWYENELLIAVSVVDDVIAEAPGFSLWQGDGLVLHCSGGAIADQPILFMLTPGIGPAGQSIEPRTLINDHRTDPTLKNIVFKPKYQTRATSSGYQMEIAIPLPGLGIQKAMTGDLIHLQIEIKDREEDTEGPSLQWNPNLNATRNPAAFNTLRLAEHSDHRPQLSAVARIVDEQRVEMLVYADASLAGLPMSVRFPYGNSITKTLSVRPGDSFALAKAVAPFTASDGDARVAEVYSEQVLLARLDLSEVPWVDSQQNFAPIPSLVRMKEFEEDRLRSTYPSDAILVIGSSSIRFWDSIEEDFAPWKVIKRGFGGSAMSDVVGAYRYLIEPYDVKRFLIYEGDTESGREMPEAFLRYARLFIEKMAVDRPDSTIVFLTPKPSPKRFSLWDSAYKHANEGLETLVAEHDNVHLIDVASPLFGENGSLREELFKSDGVHLNEAGYIIWKEIIQSSLESLFGEP